MFALNRRLAFPFSDAMSGQLWPDARSVMSSGVPDVRHQTARTHHFFPSSAVRALVPYRRTITPSKKRAHLYPLNSLLDACSNQESLFLSQDDRYCTAYNKLIQSDENDSTGEANIGLFLLYKPGKQIHGLSTYGFRHWLFETFKFGVRDIQVQREREI